MGFKLPELLGWIDIPVYEGMQMECWLNPVYDEYEPPEEDAEPWETTYQYSMGRLLRRLRVPADLTDSGEEEIIELGSARAVYDLLRTAGFDQSIPERALAAWSQQREELMTSEAKN